MLVDLFFGFVGVLLSPVLLLLPSWSPVDLSGAVDAINGLAIADWLRWVDNYVPVGPGVAAIAAIVLVTNATFLVNWLVWLLTKLHVLGGS